jgi:hypothetical protein
LANGILKYWSRLAYELKVPVISTGWSGLPIVTFGADADVLLELSGVCLPRIGDPKAVGKMSRINWKVIMVNAY